MKGYAYIAITTITGALIPLLVKASSTTNVYEFFMLTAFVSAIVSLSFILITRKTKNLISVVRNPKMLAISVLIGLLIFLPIEFGMAYAETLISVSLATVIFRMSPLLMLPLLPLVLREKLTKYQITALILAFGGIYLGVTGGTLTSIFVNADLFGVLFLIGMAFFYALSNVLTKRYMIDMGVILAIAAVSLSALFSALYLAGGGGGTISLSTLLIILFLGAYSNVFGYYMYFISLRILKTTFVTNLVSLSPFFTLIFAYAFLGEQIQLYYITIAVLVAAGILIQRLDKLGGTFVSRSNKRLRNFMIFDVSGAFADTGEITISNALKQGGRVLAVKVSKEHGGAVRDMLAKNNYSNVFTHEHKHIVNEANFVKEIVGADQNDLVLMKAGNYDERESFFNEVSDAISPDVFARPKQ